MMAPLARKEEEQWAEHWVALFKCADKKLLKLVINMKYKILAAALLLYVLALIANYMGYEKIFKILFYLSLFFGLINIIYTTIFISKENKRIFNTYFSKKKKISIENESDPKSESDLNAKQEDSQK
jgi:hypothetical protein